MSPVTRLNSSGRAIGGVFEHMMRFRKVRTGFFQKAQIPTLARRAESPSQLETMENRATWLKYLRTVFVILNSSF